MTPHDRRADLTRCQGDPRAARPGLRSQRRRALHGGRLAARDRRMHFVLDIEGEVVAHAAVVTRVLHIGGTPMRTGYVEAVATAPSHERRGLGTSVMRDVGTYISERFELGALGTGSHGSMSGWAGWPGPVRPPSGCPTESAARRTTTPTSWCSARHPRPHSTSPHRSAATGVRATSGRRVAGITMALEQVH